MSAAFALVRLKNLEANIAAVRSRLGVRPARICMPVKACAYGHGAVPVAKAAVAFGAEYLAVATTDEGEELRTAGVTAPVILFSDAEGEDARSAVENTLISFVSTKETVGALRDAAAAAKKNASVFLKIDTGMGRIGCRPEEAPGLARHIAESGLTLAGTATHFAVSDSDNEDDIARTRECRALFSRTIDAIRSVGVDPGLISAANSGALIRHPEARYDMVRPGIMLYGYDGGSFASELKPLMELRAPVVLVRKILAGESVSYGRTWTATEDTYIGVVPMGYADGLKRVLSTDETARKAYFVVINGERFPLAGRICMDKCMVNLGPSPKARPGDEVTFFGPDPPALNAAALAALAGTIPYEITCGIGNRVRRVFTDRD